jgi:hypothetical protein
MSSIIYACICGYIDRTQKDRVNAANDAREVLGLEYTRATALSDMVAMPLPADILDLAADANKYARLSPCEAWTTSGAAGS